MSSIRLAALLLVAGGATCPPLAQAGDNTVLLLADSDTAFRPVPVPSPYEAALKEMGMTYQFFSNSIAFAQAVSSADPSNTVLILDVTDYAHDFSSVVNFVNSGGRAILQDWNLDAEPNLASAFEVLVRQRILFPLAVYDWGGSKLFAGLSSPLGTLNLFTVDGQKLQPVAGGQAEAGFVNTPSANEAALVVGNNARTIVNGFALEEVTSGAQAIRLAQNEILSLTYSASATAPVIAVQPHSQTVPLGANVSFQVVAWPPLPLSFQWSKDGDELPGATNETYHISDVQSAHAGTYSVVVSNAYGSVPSSNATLTMTTVTQINTILLYLDTENGVSSPYETALLDMGKAYQKFTEANAFAQAVNDADPLATLLIIDAIDREHNFTSVVNFANAGGRAILQHWDLSADSGLATAFDVSVAQNLNSPPPVYDWGGSALFDGLTSPVQFADLFGVDGQRLEPAPGGEAVAGFVSVPTANEAALVVGNEGRTIVNGFALEEITSAAQAVQLARNEILFFFPLRFESITLSGTTVTLVWTTIPSQDYQVQYKSSPSDPSWTDFGSPITAFDTTASTTDTVTAASERIYRVQLLP